MDSTTNADVTDWLQTLHDRLALVSDRLQQQRSDLDPDLQTQVQQLVPSQLTILLETLPQLTSPADLLAWLQPQLSVA